jgi:HEAT repeat protein
MRRLLLVGVVALLAAAPAPCQGLHFLGKPAAQWARELSDPAPAVRRSAAFALGRLGAASAGSVSDLVARLREDADPGVREAAAAAVGDVVKSLKGGNAPLWAEAGPVLRQALSGDREARVRRASAYALGTFGVRAAGTAGALRTALGDKDASVRQNAAWALGQLGKDAEAESVRALCGRLSDAEALVRRDAAAALGSVGAAAAREGVPALMGLVKTESDEVVKKAALEALGHLAGPDHRGVAGALNRLLTDADAEVARRAALVLAKIGGAEAAPALPVLRQGLEDDDAQGQELAAAALAELGPAAAPAVADLARALGKGATPDVQRYAALALGHVGAPGRDFRRVMRQSENDQEKRKARESLAEIERAAREAIPALARALGPPATVEVRQYAAEALAQFGYPLNEEAVPQIVAAIRRETDPLVRQRCVWALFNLEELAKYGADKVLADVLEEKAEDTRLVRYDAARALAFALEGRAPDRVADVLLEMLQNTRLQVYSGTDANVEGAGSEAAGAQANVKANVGGDARYMAAEALGWLGAKASGRRDVVNALRAAAKDKDAKLREQSLKSLEALGVKP